MKIITNNDLPGLFDKQVEEAWSHLSDELTEGTFNPLKMLFDSHGGDWRKTDTFQLIMKTLAEVKAEMSSDAHVLVSEPSRYLHKFATTYVARTAHIKRELMKNPPSWLPRTYDMEADIRQTSYEVETHIRAHFQNELAYWKAVEDRNYGVARTILNAIAVIRPQELHLQVEVLNWQFELSTLLGDTAMFVETLNKAVKTDALSNTDATQRLVERLLITRGYNRVMAVPTAQGVLKAARHPGGFGPFMSEQLVVFSQSVIRQIAEEITKLPPATAKEFDQVLLKALGDSKRSFLAVNPYVRELHVQPA